MKIIKEQKKNNRETTHEIKNELKYKKKDTFYFCGHSTSSRWFQLIRTVAVEMRRGTIFR